MVICPQQGANDFHIISHPIISCFIKIQIGLPSTFLCRLTQVVLEKRPLNGHLRATKTFLVATDYWVSAMGLLYKDLSVWVQSRLDPCPKDTDYWDR